MTFRLSHLALLLALTIIGTAVGGVAATWWVADREFRDVLDDDLEVQSEFLAELVAADREQLDENELLELLSDAFEPDEDEDTRWVSVYDTRSGRLVSNLPHALPLQSMDDGSVRRSWQGYSWRGYQAEEDDVVVQILRREDLFLEVRKEILEDIVTPTLIGSGLNLLLLAVLIGFFTWPLTRLVRQLEWRGADSLAPLSLKTPARELQVLRDALNRMMSGVEGVLNRERQFASDVAHELRTPLTTLKLELSAPEPDMRALKQEVDRLARLVEQLLTLARLEQSRWQRQFDTLDLAPLYERVVRRFIERFAAQGIALKTDLAPAAVAGDATLLDLLLQNLLNNVLRHCPAATQVEVTLAALQEGHCLRVSDDGPGIEEDRRRQMSRGFMRMDSKSEGFGLGLAICRKIADVHGAELRFLAHPDGTSGLIVEVTFPPAHPGGASQLNA